MHYETLTSTTRKDGKHLAWLVVRREPSWAYALYVAAGWLCTLTLHRIGCNRLVAPVSDFTDRYSEEWTVPVPIETAADFLRWRGHDVWWEDIDED